jgi:hypothetical protein
MHQAAVFQFGRIVREYAEWRAVPTERRSPAPAWWWSPAMTVVHKSTAMPADWSEILSLPAGSSYEAGARAFLAAMADQTSPPWPNEFPRKLEETKAP